MGFLFKKKKIDENKLPKHIAFIMDGNGRWANKRGLPRNLGHKAGADAMKKVISACYKFGVKVVTFYCFSTENWKRPDDEVKGIFSLAKEYFEKNKEQLIEKQICIKTLGDISNLPCGASEVLNDIVEETKDFSKMIVNLAVNYGGKAEILRAVNNIISDGIKVVDDELFKSYLYTKDLPDPDIVVRTSGEMRVSGFLIYQLAYSEFYFTKIHWPDFDEKQVEKVIISYQGRNRRFGGLGRREKWKKDLFLDFLLL